MKLLQQKLMRRSQRYRAGMTLAEVVIALSITGLAVGGIVSGYAFCTASAEKAALSLAASARAMERLEETRSAQWITANWPVVDQVNAANFTNKVVTLDLSGDGQGVTSATLQTQIVQISTNPPLKRIRVDCIWRFKGVLVTNTIETCRAPDL